MAPGVTKLAKSMQQFFPPKIDNASEFENFKTRLKDKRRIWRLLFDYPIDHIDAHTVKLSIQNCPFVEAAIKLKLPELGPHICQGDWDVAKDNSEKWTFERSGTIGTGCEICDFVYKQIHN